MTLQSVSVKGVKKYIFGKGLFSHKIKEISELIHGFKKKCALSESDILGTKL
jgi:hypothetical protein